MKKNIGSADRIISLVIPASIAVHYLTDFVSGTLGKILVAIFFLKNFTSVFPQYTALVYQQMPPEG